MNPELVSALSGAIAVVISRHCNIRLGTHESSLAPGFAWFWFQHTVTQVHPEPRPSSYLIIESRLNLTFAFALIRRGVFDEE
jgi:hypothetical protein